MRIVLALMTGLLFMVSLSYAKADLAIVGATLIDGTGGEPLKDSVVLITGERITAQGKRGQIRIPKGVQIVDAQGKWIVPGLIDSHIHFFQSAGLFTRPDIIDLRSQRPYAQEVKWIQERIEYTLSRYICSGVTSVMDMGGPFWTFEVRKKASLLAQAPRVGVTGPLLATFIPEELRVPDPADIPIGNPQQARRTVDEIAKRQPDLIKIWFVPEGANASSYLPSIRAAIEEAHGKNFRVAIHATELETARMAVQAGADILVHSVFDRRVDASFLELLKNRKIIYIPTLMVNEGYREVLGGTPRLSPIEEKCGDPEVIASWKKLPRDYRSTFSEGIVVALENLRLVHQAGITVAAGSDAGNIGTLHGPALHRELTLMSQAGLSPLQIIVTATRNAAQVLNAQPETGTLKPGNFADLLILRANPLLDIKNLAAIDRVIKGGKS